MDATRRTPLTRLGDGPIRLVRVKDLLLGIALAVTFAVALALRIYGLDWDEGYDYTPHPDERAILQRVSDLSLPSAGDVGALLSADSPWNPGWFPYGSFPLYMLKVVQMVWPGDAPQDLRVVGRATSALADVATVMLVYVLGSRMYGRREGFLAALFLALSVIHIQLSHFFAVDTILGLTTIASLYFLYRVSKKGNLQDSLLAGAMIGIGLATKVSQVPIYFAFAMAHILYLLPAVGVTEGPSLASGERLARAIRGLLGGAGVSVLVFIIAQPYTLIDWPTFWADVVEQSEMVSEI